MKISVVLPTYNESQNITPIIQRVGQVLNGYDYEIVVVDDNSPDGTAEIAKKLSNRYPVNVIVRSGKLGLGTAILTGFNNATGNIVGVIDADLQHPPELIINLVECIKNGYDIAIASRYVKGGQIPNWSLPRKITSRGATLLAWPLAGVKDPMSGFFFLDKRILVGKDLSPRGYKLLLEILVKVGSKRVKEVPFSFGTRQNGSSKLGKSEFTGYLKLLAQLYSYKFKKSLGLHKKVKHSINKIDKDKNQTEIQSHNKLKISVGVCAYNEEKNIGCLLDSLQKQELNTTEIIEIMVVSSACRDKTNEITLDYAKNDSRIRLIDEPERKGKAHAVNEFIKLAKGDICLLVSADVTLALNTCEKVCSEFSNPEIGMTGGRPVPVNDPSTFMGFVSRLIWQLCHELSLIEPKLGEMIAFRNIVAGIPENTVVDEAAVESVLRKKGLKLKYIPDAIVHNNGPTTVNDFIKQRKRIYIGHLHLKKTEDYTVSSMSTSRLLKIVIKTIRPNWRSIMWTPAAMLLEFFARAQGYYEFRFKNKNPYIWDMVSTTKAAIKKQ